MANTYTWVIESLECISSIDGQNNVVSNVHWRINGTDGINNSTIYGVQKLIYTQDTPFTAYDNLTESTVIGWVQAVMGDAQVQEMQTYLDNQLAFLNNPPVITQPLPWTS